jgi:hypothetical protein
MQTVRSEPVARAHVRYAKVNLIQSSQSLQGVHNRAEGIKKNLMWEVISPECIQKKVFSEPYCGDRGSVTRDTTFSRYLWDKEVQEEKSTPSLQHK